MRAAALTEPGIWIATGAVFLAAFACAAAILDSLIDVFTHTNPLYVRRADRRS
jgi:hypothetical protein